MSYSRLSRTWGAAVVMTMMALPAAAQTLGLAPRHEMPAWRVLLALLFCCLLGFAGALALRHRLKAGADARMPGLAGQALARILPLFRIKPGTKTDTPSRLQVVETVSLSHQVDVSLLTCDGATILMVTSQQGAFVVNPDTPQKGIEPS